MCMSRLSGGCFASHYCSQALLSFSQKPVVLCFLSYFCGQTPSSETVQQSVTIPQAVCSPGCFSSDTAASRQVERQLTASTAGVLRYYCKHRAASACIFGLCQEKCRSLQQPAAMCTNNYAPVTALLGVPNCCEHCAPRFPLFPNYSRIR